MLADAARDTRTVALEALRDDLAAKLDLCESLRDYAALSQRFMDVLKQIDELGGGEQPKPEETGLSEFEKRLADRDAAAKAPRRAKSK